MPARRKPSSYIAGKRIKLFDAVYEPGQTIPLAIIRKTKALSALLGSRRIIPNVDPHYRRTKPSRSTPTDVPPSVRKGI